MKLVKGFLSLFAVAALVMFYASCDKGDPKKSEEQQQFEQLASTWTLSDARYDGISRKDDFPGLVLTLSGTFADGGTFQYSFTGTRPNPSPWKASGTWKFGQNPKEDIILDPGSAQEKEAIYSLQGNTLTIEFTLLEGEGHAAGRVSSVEGDWIFTFNKN